MPIFFTCEQCGHHVKAEDAHAGRRARCAHCGHKMKVPGTRIHREGHDHAHDHGHGEEDEPEFHLAPVDDDPPPPPRVMAPAAGRGIQLAPLPLEGADSGPSPRLAPVEGGPRFGAAPVEIPEELLADRAPIPLDPDFVPAPLAESHDHTSRAAISARAWLHRSVRSILKKLEWIENWLYLVSLAFLMIAVAGLLLEYRPLAHFGAVWVSVSSVLLGALGGIEVVIKPFQYGIFGTSWKTMKKQIRHALAAFIPLIVLILSYLFIKPIRDYFLDTAEARQARRMSSISAPAVDFGIPRAVDRRRSADRTPT